jgi:hypothetical protein
MLYLGIGLGMAIAATIVEAYDHEPMTLKPILLLLFLWPAIVSAMLLDQRREKRERQ